MERWQLIDISTRKGKWNRKEKNSTLQRKRESEIGKKNNSTLQGKRESVIGKETINITTKRKSLIGKETINWHYNKKGKV